MADGDKASVVSEQTQATYQRAGMGRRLGFGKRPALIVVDMHNAFTRPEKYPMAGDFAAELGAINQLLDAARSPRLFAVFTVNGYNDPDSEAGMWGIKGGGVKLLKLGTEATEIDARLHRQPEDLVMAKNYPSAFFATSLASTLRVKEIDTIIVTGCTTSGCVRATVLDGLCNGFRPIVPIEAVGDRAPEPHAANLFDLNAKYADVLPITEVIDYLKQL